MIIIGGIVRKVVVILFLCFINLGCVSAANSKFKVTFSSCVDGDTAKFVINDEVKTVRFLSINTPELAHFGNAAEPYGVEASDYTCNVLKSAKSIKLQYDPKSDEEDKYGRLLAWVFVDNELLQEMLIKEGLAEVKYVYDDYLYTPDLQALEVTAQENKIGMWSDQEDFSDEIEEKTFYELVVSISAMISIVIVSIFGKSSSNKKKAIKEINDLLNT